MRLAQLSHTRLRVGMPALGVRPQRSVRAPLVTAVAAVRPTSQNAAASAPKKPEMRVDGEQAAPCAVAAPAAAQAPAKVPSSPRAAALEGTNLYSMDDDDVHCTVEDLLTA